VSLLSILRRLGNLVLVLLAMTFVIFALRQVSPGDPARAVLGATASRAAIAAERHALGLDDSLPVQFGLYLGRLARGDLGLSVHTHNPVAEDIGHVLPASLELMAAALGLGVVLGVAVALAPILIPRLAVLRWGLIAVASAPIFLTGLLLSLLFWYQIGWLPGGGQVTPDRYVDGPTGLMVLDGLLTGHPAMSLDALAHLALPALTLALPAAVAIGRTLESSLRQVLRRDYIRTARSTGLTEADILLRHGLRNAAGPPLSMFGLQVAMMFGNLVVVEQIFSWPGVGLYLLQAFAASDLPAVLGVALVFATAYLLLTALIDAAQAWIDPRIGG
jgi:peptide/nickel transport system permease protein/dipeptide transport system permease protein